MLSPKHKALGGSVCFSALFHPRTWLRPFYCLIPTPHPLHASWGSDHLGPSTSLHWYTGRQPTPSPLWWTAKTCRLWGWGRQEGTLPSSHRLPQSGKRKLRHRSHHTGTKSSGSSQNQTSNPAEGGETATCPMVCMEGELPDRAFPALHPRFRVLALPAEVGAPGGHHHRPY